MLIIYQLLFIIYQLVTNHRVTIKIVTFHLKLLLSPITQIEILRSELKIKNWNKEIFFKCNKIINRLDGMIKIFEVNR